MVESKLSIYDDEPGESVALLAAAEPVDLVEAVVIEPNDPWTVATNADGDPPSKVSMDDDDEKDYHQQQRVVGAAVAASVVGLLMGGPILAVLLGCGATYACHQGGAAGDAARAVGDVALTVREKAEEFDKKHGVVEQSKVVAETAWTRAKEFDRKHNLLDRTKRLAVDSFETMRDFVHRHRLIERGVDRIGKAVYWVADKLAKALEKVPTTPVPPTETS
jgi:hypothetical protein